MSLQMETAVVAFWNRVKGTRRRDPSPPPGAIRQALGSRLEMPAPAPHRGEVPRAVIRPVLTAEGLAASYISALAKGQHAFRDLKAEFDELCIEAEIATVSDKQFAHWLLARGHRKWREGCPKVTMYRIAPSRRTRAAA